MALRYTEGFDNATTAQAAQLGLSVTSGVIIDGADGQVAWLPGTGLSESIRGDLGGSYDSGVLAFHYRPKGLPAAPSANIMLTNSGSAVVLVHFTATGGATVKINTTTIGTLPAGTIAANQQRSWQIKFVCGTDGAVEIRIDGEQVLVWSGDMTAASASGTAITGWSFAKLDGAACEIDHVAFWDFVGTGLSDFIAAAPRLALLRPTFPAAAGWGTSGATNYSSTLGDDLSGFTSFIQATAEEDFVYFHLEDLEIEGLVTVHAVAVRVVLGSNNDSAAYPRLLSGGLYAAEGDLALGPFANTFSRAIFEEDPGIGSGSRPWTVAGVNDVWIGLRNAAGSGFSGSRCSNLVAEVLYTVTLPPPWRSMRGFFAGGFNVEGTS